MKLPVEGVGDDDGRHAHVPVDLGGAFTLEGGGAVGGGRVSRRALSTGGSNSGRRKAGCSAARAPLTPLLLVQVARAAVGGACARVQTPPPFCRLTILQSLLRKLTAFVM